MDIYVDSMPWLLLKIHSDSTIIILFLFLFWLCWVLVAAQTFSLVAESRVYSLVAMCRLLIVRVFLEHVGSTAPAQYLRATSLVSPRHVGSSRIRDQIKPVSCISSWILYH